MSAAEVYAFDLVSPLQRAQKNEADALAAFENAWKAIDAAKTEAERLQTVLDAAGAAEKAQAELGEDCRVQTDAVRTAGDAVRVHSYRAAKLERDMDAARERWIDLQKVTAEALYVEAQQRVDVTRAELEQAAAVTLEKDRAYREALDDSARKQTTDRDPYRLSPPNRQRVMFSFYCTRFLRDSVYAGGKDCRGKALQPAADITQETGEYHFPLL